MKSTKTLTLIAAAAVFLSTGCARFVAVQTDTSDEKTKGRTITTKVKTFTFFAGKAELAKLKAAQTDKSQTVGLGTLNQTAEGTNVLGIVEAIIGAAVRAAKP